MGKKLIYLLILLFIGGFIVMQSCNESPIVSNEPFIEKGNQLPIYQNNGILTARTFYGVGTEEPIICSEGEKVPIYAGQNTYAGYIEITSFVNGIASGNLVFQNKGYPTANDPPGIFPWAISQIHIHIANTLSGIPQNPAGNPIIGGFAINNSYDPPTTGTMDPVTNLYYIPFTYPEALTGSEFYVAVHAVVCTYGGAEGFDFYLPDGPVTYNITHNSPASYFKVEITNGGEFLNSGIYESFCVDADLNIYPPKTYTGTIHTSTGILPPECLSTAIENWSNMDLVNWIINEYPVNSSVPQHSYSILPTVEQGFPFTGIFTPVKINEVQQYGTVTWQDLQAAIWALLEGGEPLSDAWGYLQPQSALTYNNVWGIVNAALTNPEANGFIPECEDVITAILCPDGGNVQIITIQPTITLLQMPCDTQCETAWGDGKDGANFVPNKSWATYFKWNINDCTMPRR